MASNSQFLASRSQLCSPVWRVRVGYEVIVRQRSIIIGKMGAKRNTDFVTGGLRERGNSLVESFVFPISPWGRTRPGLIG